MDIGSQRLDETKVEEGVWVEVDDGVEFLIASTRRKAYQDALAQAAKSRRKGFRNSGLSEEDLVPVARRLAARHLLLDWKGITENGAEVPYSVQKAEEFMTDPALAHLAEFVVGTAAEIARFQVDSLEESAGN